MRSLLLLIGSFLAFGPLLAQDDTLTRLLNEREQLTLEYQYYNKQNNNFWGKKSKKDLLHIIETLKNIINKDSEIIKEVNIQSLKKQAKVTVETGQVKRQVFNDQRVAMDNVYDLKRDVASLQNVVKVRQREINTLQEKLEETRKKQHDTEKIMALAGGFCLVLLIYIFILRSKLSRAAVRTPRARK